MSLKIWSVCVCVKWLVGLCRLQASKQDWSDTPSIWVRRDVTRSRGSRGCRAKYGYGERPDTYTPTAPTHTHTHTPTPTERSDGPSSIHSYLSARSSELHRKWIKPASNRAIAIAIAIGSNEIIETRLNKYRKDIFNFYYFI